MTRKLDIEKLANTEDTGDPVIAVELEDTGSHMTAILTNNLNTVRVWTIESNHKGDMSVMVDEVCRQLETTEVHFLEPDISAVISHGPELEDLLHDYERIEEMVTLPDGSEEKSTYLKTEWHYEED